MRVVDAATPGIDLDELVATGAPQVPYTGNGLPPQSWFDAARARGLDPPWLVQETISQRSQYGFPAGQADALFAESRARSRGHTGHMAYVLSDGNGADAWDTQPYRDGVLSVATLPTDIWYGAVGVGANWVPETWGHGAFASQLVYEKSPYITVGHDLNEVHAELPPPEEDMALTQPEHDALMRIDGALKSLNYGDNGGGDGSMQQQVGLMSVVLGVPNGSGNLTPLIQQIAKLLAVDGAAPVNVEDVVSAVHQAWTNATNANEWQMIEAAIRASLA